MDNDKPRCPWCDSEYWTAKVEVGLTWFQCVYCECIWSLPEESEVTP